MNQPDNLRARFVLFRLPVAAQAADVTTWTDHPASGHLLARRSAATAGYAYAGPDSEGDSRRVAIAWAIWRTTSMPQRWIAEQLGLRSAALVQPWV